jgi:hypothetical protein
MMHEIESSKFVKLVNSTNKLLKKGKKGRENKGPLKGDMNP